MTQSSFKSNRGPAAAEENRQAILAAARTLFRVEGYGVALSRIARAAGVGQGVLYRHFPTRLDLAFAVFEDHFEQYSAIAALKGPDTFSLLWARIVDHLIDRTAFVDMVIDARASNPDYDGLSRLRRILRDPLDRAIAAGRVPPDLDAEEVLMGIRMAYGIVRTSAGLTPPAELRNLVFTSLPRLSKGAV